MKLSTTTIHNFRSIIHQSVKFVDYSLLVGQNNAGKSNIMMALRIFYEEIKWSEKSDWPKVNASDEECWIELEFLTTEEEQKSLRKEYQSNERILKVRKYLKSPTKDLVKPNQSNVYAYENGVLSKNLFYGAKNVSIGKLGKLIYIPSVSKSEDHFKVTGPSTLRDIIEFVVKKVVKKSPSYSALDLSFGTFNKEFKKEDSSDGYSLNSITDDINKNVEEWDISFGLEINPITPDSLIKNLISHSIRDKQLNDQEIDLNCYGQGLQRHLIYTLIKVGASCKEDDSKESKTEFMPDFTLLLFEEPEAFLHPTQQQILNRSLTKLSEGIDQQVIISSHSSIFISKNIDDLPRIIRAKRNDGITKAFQIEERILKEMLDSNAGLYKVLIDLASNPSTSNNVKEKLKTRYSIDPNNPTEAIIEEESLNYFLWLDSEKACSILSKHVFICEGASERVLFEYLVNNNWDDLQNKNYYFLDSEGKFNIHRYMKLFEMLGIEHSVIYDRDNDAIQENINKFLMSKQNLFTKGIYSFDPDMEAFLEIPQVARYRKPLNILWHLINKKISVEKINELRKIIDKIS